MAIARTNNKIVQQPKPMARVTTAPTNVQPGQSVSISKPVTNPAPKPRQVITPNPASTTPKTNNPAATLPARNAGEFTRVSPGVFRDTKTGKLVRGSDPTSIAKNLTPKATNPVGNTPTTNTTPEVSDPLNTTTNTATDTTTPTDSGGETTTTPQFTPEMLAALFPTTDMANDPVYQQSLKRGQESIDRRLASNGLMGSGREFEISRDMVSELDANTQARYNTQRQENATRLANILNQTADRNVTQNQQDWQRQLDAARLLVEQNPTNFAKDSFDESNAITKDLNTKGASNTAGNYKVARPGSAGAAPTRPVVDQSAYNKAMLDLINKSSGAQGANNTAGLVSGGAKTIGALLNLFS